MHVELVLHLSTAFELELETLHEHGFPVPTLGDMCLRPRCDHHVDTQDYFKLNPRQLRVSSKSNEVRALCQSARAQLQETWCSVTCGSDVGLFSLLS